MDQSTSDSPAAPDSEQLDDNTLAWGYAMNLDLVKSRDTDTAEERAEYQRRFDDYAQTLLYDLHADADRLIAVIEHHRTRAEVSTDHPGANRIRLLTVELAEAGLKRIRAADAEDDEEARERLYAELKAANTWTPAVYRQGPFHQHRAVRRILRRTNLVWWVRRLDARMSVSLDDSPSPDDPGHTRRVAISYRGQDIGRLDYRVCTNCRIGFVAKLSVDEEHQDRGIATRALAKTRLLYPGFQWCTSGQYVTARTFWARTARKSGERYLPPDDQLRPCSHIDR